MNTVSFGPKGALEKEMSVELTTENLIPRHLKLEFTLPSPVDGAYLTNTGMFSGKPKPSISWKKITGQFDLSTQHFWTHRSKCPLHNYPSVSVAGPVFSKSSFLCSPFLAFFLYLILEKCYFV